MTYVENYFSAVETTDAVANIVTEVFANANAKVTYGAVDTLDKGYTTYVNRRGVTGRDARIEWALGLMNDGDTISDNTTYLFGDGSYWRYKNGCDWTWRTKTKLHNASYSSWFTFRWSNSYTWCHER